MMNNFVKITTSNGEERWVNLSRVTRISLSRDQGGESSMTFCFDGTDKVTVHGSDERNREVIRRLVAQLDHIASVSSRAA